VLALRIRNLPGYGMIGTDHVHDPRSGREVRPTMTHRYGSPAATAVLSGHPSVK
jgi:hypothetical protein